MSRTRIVVAEDGAFDFQVLLMSKEKGKLSTVDEFLALCERMTNSEYKFCPGIDPDVYVSTYFSKIRYHVKTVRHLEVPFNRVDSIHCLLWHKLARNMLFEKDLESVPCKACRVCGAIRNARVPKDNLSKDQRKALKELREMDDITILPADKGNATVLMDKKDYHNKLSAMLNTGMYGKLSKDPTKSRESKLTQMLKGMERTKELLTQLYNRLRPGVVYQVPCSCGKVYIGETIRRLETSTRMLVGMEKPTNQP